jgi:hypothetical protein
MACFLLLFPDERFIELGEKVHPQAPVELDVAIMANTEPNEYPDPNSV